MNRLAADILSYLFIGTAVALALILYPQLPDNIPTHWNAAGEIDGYMRKPWGVFLLPMAAVFTLLIMKIVPAISWQADHSEKFGRTVSLFQVVIVAFMSMVAVLVLLAARGFDVPMNEIVFAGIGLLFVVIGLSLRQVEKNFFMGIRTPWTLKNDEVWARTHQLGGKMFVVAGAFLILNAFIDLPIVWTLATIIAIVLWPVLYSFFLYHRLRSQKDSH